MKVLSLSLLAVVLSAVVVSAADKPAAPGAAKSAAPAAQAAAPSADQQQAMMQKWMEVATPSEAHKKLEASVGTWDTAVKMWMSPDAPPQESTGVSKNTMVLGGRWLEQSFEGTMMGQPFHGIGYTGYDNYKKQYVGMWMDTSSTSAMMSTGMCDPSGKTMTFTGTVDNIMTGGKDQFKEVLTIVDADHQNFEMWAPGPDGKMYKNMEIRYTRKA
ncbi:MAG: DUF1579 domain-containing protein [bacterium]